MANILFLIYPYLLPHLLCYFEANPMHHIISPVIFLFVSIKIRTFKNITAMLIKPKENNSSVSSNFELSHEYHSACGCLCACMVFVCVFFFLNLEPDKVYAWLLVMSFKFLLITRFPPLFFSSLAIYLFIYFLRYS